MKRETRAPHPKRDERKKKARTTDPKAERRRKEKADELVDEASDESFPASDPPAFTTTHAGEPQH